MFDVVLLCMVLIVPTLLALVALDAGGFDQTGKRSDDYTLASVGVFWDRPARKPHDAGIQRGPLDAELGDSRELDWRSPVPPVGAGAPAPKSVAPDKPEQLPVAV